MIKFVFIFSTVFSLLAIDLVKAESKNRFQYLVDGLAQGSLKTQITQCLSLPLQTSDFSISHRGAPMGYPEHSKEGYLAAIEMGDWQVRRPCPHS